MIQHTNGTIAEYTAASHFLANGYDVWWPATQQSRADFIISCNGKYEAVQVKKGTWSRSGTNEYLQTRLVSRNAARREYDEGDFDLLVVVDGARLWIIPFADVKGMTSLCLDSRGPTAWSRKLTKYDPTAWLVTPQP